MTQELTWLDPNVIETDWGTQHRPELNPAAVGRYSEDMDEHLWVWERDPARVYYDGQHYGMEHGFHRLAAAKIAKVTKFGCIVLQGTRRDAILASVEENKYPTEPLSNAAKRNKVSILLNDQEWSQWSDREIARRCGVSDRFVNKQRAALTANGSQSPDMRIGADGRTTNVSNIGKKPEVKPPGWMEQLLPEKIYPYKAFIRHIWNDPFGDIGAATSDPRYRFSFQFANGAYLSKQDFWNFTLGEAAPAPTEEQIAAVKLADGEETPSPPAPLPQRGEGGNPQPPAWLELIRPEKYYPLKMLERRIWMEPLPSREAVWGDPRYWNHGNTSGKLILEAKQFWSFEVVEPSPATEQEIADFEEHHARLRKLQEQQSAPRPSAAEGPQRPAWLDQIDPTKVYPIRASEKRVWPDAFDELFQARLDPRYYAFSVREGKTLIKDNFYWDFEMMPPLPMPPGIPTVEAHPKDGQEIVGGTPNQFAVDDAAEDDEFEDDAAEDGDPIEEISIEEIVEEEVRGFVDDMVNAYGLTGQEVMEHVQAAILALTDEGA